MKKVIKPKDPSGLIKAIRKLAEETGATEIKLKVIKVIRADEVFPGEIILELDSNKKVN